MKKGGPTHSLDRTASVDQTRSLPLDCSSESSYPESTYPYPPQLQEDSQQGCGQQGSGQQTFTGTCLHTTFGTQRVAV